MNDTIAKTRGDVGSPFVVDTIDDGEPSPKARLRPHWLTALVILVGLTLAAVLALGASASNNENENRLLRLQVRQVAAALVSAIQNIKAPITASLELYRTEPSGGGFRRYAASIVGPLGAFRGISVWSTKGGTPHLLTLVGADPEIDNHPAVVRQFFAKIKPNSQLYVYDHVLTTPARTLGYAEMLTGTHDGFVVYAEGHLPQRTRVAVAKNSAFSDLNFVLYLGRTRNESSLIENTVPLPLLGRQASAVVPFGSSEIAIESTPAGDLAGALPSRLPLFISIAGLLLTVVAAMTSEHLVRRRELAEVLAAENRRLYRAQRGIAQTLQIALLPVGQPEFPGTEIAVRYVPGVQDLEIGGDWYDVISLDRDRVFLVVGDVSGRGLKAATTMAYLRHAIRAYAVQGDGPDVVLQKLDQLISVGKDECFATVICALADIPARQLTLASAGHPPAVMVDADGARLLNIPVGSPVGVRNASPTQATTVPIQPGATLIAYTDGLIEKRGVPLSEGLETLRSAATDSGGTMSQVLDRILGTLIPSGSDDDIAVMGVRWTK